MMDSGTILNLANVESAYGPIRAIRGVSLKVARGEIAAVLGSNGAGKTTILKTISGIIDPRRGVVEFKGESITAKDPAVIVQRGLSHVPEGREVFPLLSVRDNLLMGAYTRKDRDAVGRDIELECTGGGHIETADQIEDSRLAGAIGPDQRKDFSPLDIEADLIDCQHPAKSYLQIACRQQG